MSRPRSATLLAALGLVAASLPAISGAQDSRLESRLDPAVRAVVAPLVDSARAAGLPVEPLIDKALEGSTKRASPGQIATVLRALGRDLSAARAALGARSTHPEIIAGAGALKVGIPAMLLQQLRSVRPDRPLTVPLVTLSDLVAHGVPVDTAAAVVLALATAGGEDKDFVALLRNVEGDIRAGLTPAAAASVRVRAGPPSGVPAGRPERPSSPPPPPPMP